MRNNAPPHLCTTTWLKHESDAAKESFKAVRQQLKRLSSKVSEKRVHDTRVALRRFMSIWKVLVEDGWQTERCKKEYIKPLKRLQKMLGQLRDVDVNIELGKKLGCSERLIKLWTSRRHHLKEQIAEFVYAEDIEQRGRQARTYLKKRARKIEDKLPRAKSGQSAFDHLELFLLHQESLVKEESETAQTPEELHQLRLSIKRWRYLLTEFFGLTNLQLVRAQSLLGQLHDLDRLTPLLVHDEEQRMALLKLKEKRHELLTQIDAMRTQLPYGLRPHVTSLKSASSPALQSDQHK